MLIEYAHFALDCIIQIGIMVVLCGITVSIIAFMGGFLLWLFDKAREEKPTWMD